MINNFKIKNFLLDIFFPKFCVGCGKEGIYLCEDCKSCLEISEQVFCLCEKPNRLIQNGKCNKCKFKKLDGLYLAVSYKNQLVKKIIHQFKYEPLIKELSESLTDLIITHFLLLNKVDDFWKDKILIPIPLYITKLKRRGFNQAEEIAKNLSNAFKAPLLNDCLIKIKETPAQMELSEKERKENLKGAFEVKEKERIKNQKIILIDDVYTTGATMEEAAKILKEAGAKEVWGIVIARGS